jgi:chaperonin cofactor prefoldin
MEALINELRASNEGSEQLKQKVASLESDIRSKNKTVAALREEIYKHKVEGDRLIG